MPHNATIESVTVRDVRFRFERLGAGSDANNPEPHYSNPYVTVKTSEGEGVGIGFTLGRGNELVCHAVEELAPLVIGRSVGDLVDRFGETWRALANPLQSRWIAPGAGPYHMAAGAITNAVFDAWSRQQDLPLWKALSRLEPEQIVAMLDFRYLEHLLTADEALAILRANAETREGRIAEIEERGLPCYHTTWIGSGTEELLAQIESIRASRGISAFKVKVGSDIAHDHERLSAIRERFGDSIDLFVDANQVWSVPAAIEWMRALAEYRITWIEEPTAPDQIEGHRRIREALAASGIEVVTGENCPNSHVAAQFIAGGAVDRFQIDACRVMGPPENIVIMLVAAKYGIPICPHAGGSGLDELVPHLAAFNYVCCAPTLDRVIVEQVGFCADFFVAPSEVRDGRVAAPRSPGYIVGMRPDALLAHEYPDGSAWRAAP
ncbi:MAG: enolase C-terminal domain-like protein [Spirochaetota bacterium]